MNRDARMIKLLQAQPFFKDLPTDYFALIADCAELTDFKQGDYLLQQNQRADVFYLLIEGRVSLRAHLPAQGTISIETPQAPAALGWSWLVPPHKWHFDVMALTMVKTVLVHTPCIMGKIENDRAFGYEMYKRFIEVVVDRLRCAQLQMMDIYARPEQTSL